ncbi:MAG: hypothetical protein C0594_03070 [Marinilabiliales bacterium]|nr:MAG: hypothetical protein C0594_03070 [Marinilabiliales bacterium]
MKYFLLLVFLFTTLVGQSQYANSYKNKGVLAVPKTKTVVALLGNRAYDEAIQQAMKEYWTHSEYEFKPMKEINNLISDENLSFILPLTFTILNADQHQLALIIGGKPDISKYTVLHLVAYAMVDGLNTERNYEECAYRMPHMIKSINSALDLVKSEKITMGAKDKLNAYYVSKAPAIKDKELLVSKDFFGPGMKEDEFGQLYKHPYKIVEPEVIAKAIADKDSSKAYLLNINTKNTYTMVFDAATGDVLYTESDDKITRKQKVAQLSNSVGK